MGTGKSPFVWASGCGQEIVKPLPVLLSRTPASVFRLVLLEPVGGGWVGFRSEGKLYCDQRCELRLFQWQAAVGLLCGVPAAGALPLTLQTAVPGAASPHTGPGWRLGWRVLRSVCMWPRWGAGADILHWELQSEGLSLRPLHTGSCEPGKLD